MDDKSRITYWLEMSEYDIETARVMLSSKRYLYVGFMCQQAIEKILKGYFIVIHKDKTPPFTHNLTRLSKESKIYDEFSEEQRDLIDTLEPLNIEVRYPNSKEALFASLTENVCKKIIIETEELQLWIKSKF